MTADGANESFFVGRRRLQAKRAGYIKVNSQHGVLVGKRMLNDWLISLHRCCIAFFTWHLHSGSMVCGRVAWVGRMEKAMNHDVVANIRQLEQAW